MFQTNNTFLVFLLCGFFTTIIADSRPTKILPEIVLDQIIIDDDWRWINASDVLFDPDNEFIGKTPNGYSIFSSCSGASFKCRAPYPVYWTIDKVEEIDSLFSYSVNTYTIRNGLSIQQNQNPIYEAVIKFWVDGQGFTRNYTCRSAQDEHLQTSTFLFIQGPFQNFLVNAGKKIELGIDDRDSLVVPCGVSTEDVGVILFKEDTQIAVPFNITTWKGISTNDSIKYDPRLGFTLTVQDLPDILGLYKCAIDENEEDVVHINIDLISPIPDQNEENFKTRSIIKGSAKMEYDYSRDTMICCSNSDKKPKMQTMTCSNPAECEISKRIALAGNKKQDTEDYWMYGSTEELASNCVRSYGYQPIFWIRCEGDGIDVLSQFYYAFNLTNERLDRMETSVMYYTLPKAYKIIPVTEPSPLESLIMITFNRVYIQGDMDLQQINEDSYYLFYMRYGPLDDDGVMYAGTPLAFHCNFSPYIFSEGAYLEFVWKDGTQRRMQGKSDDYIKGSTSVAIALDEQLVSVRCSAGVWNSTEWASKLLNLTVTVPVAPQIEGPEVSEIYYVVNETSKILECEVSGKPLPEITWQKDGKSLLGFSLIYTVEKQNSSSLLKISSVTHETHGEYSCNATNIGGTAIKSFIVFVQEESGISGWTIAAIVIALSIVIGYLIFVLWKTQVHRKILQNMTSATFQEP